VTLKPGGSLVAEPETRVRHSKLMANVVITDSEINGLGVFVAQKFKTVDLPDLPQVCALAPYLTILTTFGRFD